jgi:hypothetical protein
MSEALELTLPGGAVVRVTHESQRKRPTKPLLT